VSRNSSPNASNNKASMISTARSSGFIGT
jgi:hypothetical protein